MQNSAKGASCTSTRGETSPRTIENNHLAVCDETSLVAPYDYFASDLFMPGGYRLGLSDHDAAKHRRYYFLTMQTDAVLIFKQFDSNIAFL